MAKTKGFLDSTRKPVPYRPVDTRIKDYREIEVPLTPDDVIQQCARCADCGIPFCHGSGCPLKNQIPEFNELVYLQRWRQACQILHSTNNFPEITGRVCPAPCEASCTLSVNDKPVLIRHIEFQIVEKGFNEGWIVPLAPAVKSGKRVAIIGSGPAGLAAAQQLARVGHKVTLFERDEKPGGILRYGIPDFKLEKWVIDRRLEQLAAEGVEFQTGVKVGEDISASYLCKRYDAICLATGSGVPRDITVPGRGYENIIFAMDFLKQQNKILADEIKNGDHKLNAAGKNVVVIGGGDTGSDCVGTSRRHGAASITQIEILPQPPQVRPPDTPWPMWPRIMRTSSSHEEGCDRRWSVLTKQFSGTEVRVSHVHCVLVEWTRGENNKWKFAEIPGSEFSLKADLVLLAMGFLHPEHGPFVRDLDLKLDGYGNILTENSQTSNPKVFAAGDAVSGASLVVRAIDSGRKAANAIDAWLKKS